MIFKNFLKILLTYVVTVIIISFTRYLTSKSNYETSSTLSTTKIEDHSEFIIEFLFQNNIFLTDIDKLREVEIFINTESLEIYFQKYFYLKNTPSFGIFSEYLQSFLDQTKNYDKFVIKEHYASYNNRNRTTLVELIVENQLKIQINVFYKRNEFLYIGGLNDLKNTTVKWFNDVPRAMQNFNLTTVYDSSMQAIKIPDNLKRFFYDYNHSKFIECNSEMVKRNYELSNETYFQNKTLNEQRKPCLVYIAQQLESMYKTYWLSSGTLLGWYRDCGMIPYTLDADLSIFAEEYEDKIKSRFRGNKVVSLYVTNGMKFKGYELRVVGCDFTFDLFLHYKVNNRKQCNYYHSVKIFSVCFRVIQKFCSGELFGNKFIVPCDVVDILSENYGVQSLWSDPRENNYYLGNIAWGNGEVRKESDLPYLYRYYFQNGTVDAVRTLAKINEYYKSYNKTLRKLPKDDDDYL